MSSLNSKLWQSECLYIDCQTTGATPEHGHLLEVAWSQSKAQDKVKEVTSFVVKQPEGYKVPFRIQNLTGITDDDINSAIESQELFERLAKVVANEETGFAVIHYAKFEKPFLNELFMRLGRTEFPLPIICTHQIAQRLYPNLPTRGIRGLAGYFGASTAELKRSAHHIELTGLIWQSLAENLKNQGIETVEALLEWLKEPVQQGSRQTRVKSRRYQFLIEDNKRLALPDEPGIYRMHDRQGKVLYVGKATSLKSRVNSYFRGRKGKDSRKLEMLTQTWDITVTVTATAVEAALLEADEIKRFAPAYNVSLKEGARKIAFYSRDFLSTNSTFDDHHRIGPFSSTAQMDSVQRLSRSLTTGVFDPFIFFDAIEPQILSDGFDIFCTSLAVEKSALSSVRSLLTVGMNLLREELRAAKRESESLLELDMLAADIEGEDGVADDASLAVALNAELEPDENSGDNDPSSAEWTADELADRYYRMLVRTARAYMRTKLIKRLANSDITFTERHRTETLSIRSTRILPAEERLNQPSWSSGLGVDAYDRMSVLALEITRLRAADRLLSIH